MPGKQKAGGVAPNRRKQGTARPHVRGRAGGNLTAAQLADRDRRDEIAYALRLSGEYSLQRIAEYPDPERPGETLYGDKSSAAAGWRRACERHATGDVSMTERRDLFSARYETLLRVCWGDAIRGGRGYLFAVDRCIALMREQRDMLGMDAPTQVDVNVNATSDFDTEYRKLHEQMAAQAAGRPALPPTPQQIEGPPES